MPDSLLTDEELLAKPLLLQVHDYIGSYLPFADLMLILKGISTVFILTVFYHHAVVSTTREFRTNYPVLYSKLDLKYYNRVKWAFAAIPMADVYFIYLLVKHRYNTVSFLKSFAVKQKKG